MSDPVSVNVTLDYPVAPEAVTVTVVYPTEGGSGASDVSQLTTNGLTTSNMLRVKSGGGLEQRTPAQVLSDIGALPTRTFGTAASANTSAGGNGSSDSGKVLQFGSSGGVTVASINISNWELGDPTYPAYISLNIENGVTGRLASDTDSVNFQLVFSNITQTRQWYLPDVSGTLSTTGTTLAHYGITDAAKKREYKDASFTAAAYGRYHVKGSATANQSVAITDPPAPVAGDIYSFIVLDGTYVRMGGVDYYGSRFEIEREYNGSAWVTQTPYLTDALQFAAAAKAPTVTNLCGVTNDANTTIVLAAADSGTIKRCTASTAVSISMPTSDAGDGFNIMIIQAGAGQITFAAGSGNTLNSYGSLLKTAGQHACATIVRTAASTYNLSGNLA